METIEKPQVRDVCPSYGRGVNFFPTNLEDSCFSRRYLGSAVSLEQGWRPMARDRADDYFTIVVALKRFSKRFAEGKGGLSQDELACVTGLGSDRLTHCLALLATQGLITSAVIELSRRRLFFLTRAAIERLPANRSP